MVRTACCCGVDMWVALGCHRRTALAVLVVPVPPLVRRSLRIPLRRILPLLLAAERSDVEKTPGASHLLIPAAVDEVRSEDLVAVADERVRAVPLVHAEVGVEAVLD